MFGLEKRNAKKKAAKNRRTERCLSVQVFYGMLFAIVLACGSTEDSTTTKIDCSKTPNRRSCSAAGGSTAIGGANSGSGGLSTGGNSSGGSAGSDGFSGAGGNVSGGATGTGGSGGTSGQLVCPMMEPSPPSAFCGDGIVGPDEACDDGDLESATDACDANCEIRVFSIVEAVSADTEEPTRYTRKLGRGRHTTASTCSAVGVTYSEFDALTDETHVYVAALGMRGERLGAPFKLTTSGTPALDPNSVITGVPDGTFIASWNQFDADEIGIALAKIDPQLGVVAGPKIANSFTDFTQADPDIIWTGTGAVVAWVDYSDPFTGPDLRYRRFSAQLAPLGAEQTLAATLAHESAVALVAFNGDFAAAWRSGQAGQETLVVRSGDSEWSIGPYPPGAAGDPPALAVLDPTHIFLAFSQGTDPLNSGTHVARLYGAVIDTSLPSSAVITPFAIAPLVEPYASEPWVSQDQPNALTTLTSTGLQIALAWRSAPRPGDPAAEELWGKALLWDPLLATLGLSAVEQSQSTATGSPTAGDQRFPGVTVAPFGASLVAWVDAAGPSNVRAVFYPGVEVGGFFGGGE